MKLLSFAAATITLLALAGHTFAGPAAYGICQAGCAGVVMACCSAAGFTWGATLGASAPPTFIACYTAFWRLLGCMCGNAFSANAVKGDCYSSDGILLGYMNVGGEFEN
jgi:hypothetical protein